ncbi:hypothetical protein [Haloferula sp. BvORR071]|uniref:hypothetical protein n=1 Tax=Haloferula sp. BvORR071 TaxID=1396141 RepID=UPI0005542867|nr:hypothetical protein [Haloferula sp. BvORR071]
MDQELVRYLNDHLAGAGGAIKVIQTLADRAEEEEKRLFFQKLKQKVEDDRGLLKRLLEKLGQDTTALADTLGAITAKASHLKLRWEGLDANELGHFEAIEMLALGIQGKRLLWLMLGRLQPRVPEWQGIDFNDLERQAVEQRDAVETLRMEAGVGCLIDKQRQGIPLQEQINSP